MKKIFLFLSVILISTNIQAQYMLAKGDKQINAGLGFSNWGIPVYVGFDYGVHQDISVGGEVSFRNYSDRWNDHRYNHTIFGISGNGNYHFNTIFKIPKNWDAYAGINIGFYAESNSDDHFGNGVSGLGLGAQIGGRYYINDNLGLNLELGGGNIFSSGKFGISYKF